MDHNCREFSPPVSASGRVVDYLIQVFSYISLLSAEPLKSKVIGYYYRRVVSFYWLIRFIIVRNLIYRDLELSGLIQIIKVVIHCYQRFKINAKWPYTN